MSSRTALRRERIAQAVLDGAVGNLELVAEQLSRRLRADGVAQAVETGMAPAVPVDGLSAEAAHAVATLRDLQEEMSPGTLPDWGLLQRVISMVLAFYTSNYMILDDVHQQEAAEEWVPRDRRDQALSSAYEDMLAVRRYVAGVLDPRAADSLLGLSGSTATQPLELRRQMQSAIRRLRDSGSHVPKPQIEGLEPDWEPAVRQLERGLVQLDEAVQGLAAESTAALHARSRRDQALVAHRDAVTACRFMLRGLYILAGRRDLLDSIRSPFSRRVVDDLEEDDGDFPLDDAPGETEAPPEESEPVTPDVRDPSSEPTEGGAP